MQINMCNEQSATLYHTYKKQTCFYSSYIYHKIKGQKNNTVFGGMMLQLKERDMPLKGHYKKLTKLAPLREAVTY